MSLAVPLALSLLAIPIGYLALPAAVKILLRRRFLDKMRGSGSLCLTFDDGPDPAATPAILELLDRHGVKATFFLVGEKVERHPDIVDSLVRSGHEIGWHGYSHMHPFFCGPVRSVTEISRWEKVMGKWNGVHRTSLYRPPFGKFNLAGLLCLWAKGKKAVFWDLDPKDYRQSSAGALASEIVSGAASSSVILLHDGRTSSAAGDGRVTVRGLEIFLRETSGSKVRFRTVGEALGGTGVPERGR